MEVIFDGSHVGVNVMELNVVDDVIECDFLYMEVVFDVCSWFNLFIVVDILVYSICSTCVVYSPICSFPFSML